MRLEKPRVSEQQGQPAPRCTSPALPSLMCLCVPSPQPCETGAMVSPHFTDCETEARGHTAVEAEANADLGLAESRTHALVPSPRSPPTPDPTGTRGSFSSLFHPPLIIGAASALGWGRGLFHLPSCPLPAHSASWYHVIVPKSHSLPAFALAGASVPSAFLAPHPRAPIRSPCLSG